YVAEPYRRANTRVDLQQLWHRIATLEERVAALGSAGVVPCAEEEAARRLLSQAVDAAEALDPDTARSLLERLEREHPNTQAGRSIDRLRQELEIVGRPEAPLQLEGWIQGRTDHQPDAPTLYVFWELWCPRCQRELPRLQPLLDHHQDQGLQILALTRMTRDVERVEVQRFLAEHGLSFPVALDSDGALSQHYGVRGIPAAAMVVGGSVIWRGHPAHLDDELIERFLDARWGPGPPGTAPGTAPGAAPGGQQL
ncbi:MAG TPA: TlpA family protein disulfide reductase, partial [Deltaproteobacteria bacterium]|nr:TlpA family protein disulfide reductase [Deltaproteobacteria bacterium]